MSIHKEKKAVLTPFADFVINAKSREKKRIYKRVLEAATKKQNELIGRIGG